MPLIGFAFSEASLKFLEAVQPKIRAKKLQGVTTSADEPVYRERSGDYRILYVVRENPHEVVILDIGHRKDVYR